MVLARRGFRDVGLVGLKGLQAFRVFGGGLDFRF